MDPQNLLRLQKEQKKALSETDSKIDQLKQFKADYETLQDRLKTLPDKLTQDVMVPFGKLAFMPGQLVHTNEILVLLGDNWFVERSAKQAAEIAGRRIKGLDNNLKELMDQRRLLEPRLGFTSELQAELQGRGDQKEIVEEYDEEKEKLWDEQHKKNVKQHRAQLQKRATVVQSSESGKESPQDPDLALWSRLDELERLETERGEMDSSDDDDDGAHDIYDKQAGTTWRREASDDRKISWADENRGFDNSCEVEDSDDGDDEYEEEEYDEGGDEEETETYCPTRPSQRTIQFSHSPSPAILPHQVSASGDGTIQSPADIYKLFSPKPILKKPGVDGTLSQSDLTSSENSALSQHNRQKNNVVPVPGQPRFGTSEERQRLHEEKGVTSTEHSRSFKGHDVISSSAQKAFTGLVVQKSTDSSQYTTSTSPEITSSLPPSVAAASKFEQSLKDEPPKRVSKFKASRMKQT